MPLLSASVSGLSDESELRARLSAAGCAAPLRLKAAAAVKAEPGAEDAKGGLVLTFAEGVGEQEARAAVGEIDGESVNAMQYRF